VGGKEIGAFEREEVIKKIHSGEIRKDARVLRDGMPDWVEAGNLPELEDHFEAMKGVYAEEEKRRREEEEAAQRKAEHEAALRRAQQEADAKVAEAEAAARAAQEKAAAETRAREEAEARAKAAQKAAEAEAKRKTQYTPAPSSYSGYDNGYSGGGTRGSLFIALFGRFFLVIVKTLVKVLIIFAIIGGIFSFAGKSFFPKIPNIFNLFGKSAASQTAHANGSATAAVTSNVNFRKGPSTDNAIIRQLKQGDTVTLTGETSGGWTQVSHNGDIGWVSSDFINMGETAPPTAQTAPQQTQTPAQAATSGTPAPQVESTAGEIAEWARGNYPGNIAVNANSITGSNINIRGARTVVQPPLSGHHNLKWAYIYVGDKKYGVVWDRTTYTNSWHEGIELGMGSEARSAFDFYSGSDKDGIFSDIAREAPGIKVVK
jgi:chemotaxis protein histidine kinase CheA